MNVIARKTLKQFWTRHTDAEQELKSWYHEVKRATWQNSAELKNRYPKASIINSERVVFNICRNSYRLVVRINYESGTVFIKFIGTHAEYDAIDVETI
ncbi:MAG: type II toxin-antitoxin system HigB family toxin [Acidobacteria bacterium]|nr:MAG: type II toxin-antitoxin system HigB family toxin [Acidobacteriota bacterium]